MYLDHTKKRLWRASAGIALLVLVFVLSACGRNSDGSSSTGASGAAPTPAQPSPTAVKGYGTNNGCPSDLVITAPAKANVMVKVNNVNTTISAHTGDLIEVQLPFGQKWSGPTASQGILELQNPAGYAMKADRYCVWHFQAKGSGSTQLSFTGRAICAKNQMCPMYITNLSFTIAVK